ncbi:MAG TPA: hypothetical protein VK217_06760 [Acidimicrobiales bacterium]|nr:hypothetical protein [Acidimicrobiales bacterium]
MTQPKFAPILEQHEVREVQRIGAPAAWTPHRPGENRPTPQLVRQAGLGVPGPDQGYALELVSRFEDRLVLERDERAEDVFAGAVAIALRRAASFGRAPVAADIELALGLFGYLARDDGAPAPSDLVSLRRERFAGAEHDYWSRRAIADAVPEGALRLSPASLAENMASEPGSWRELVGA